MGRVVGPASLFRVGLGPCTEHICGCVWPEEEGGKDEYDVAELLSPSPCSSSPSDSPLIVPKQY